MKTKPWFASASKSNRDEEVAVYHDNTACMEGDNIPKDDKRAGTDNRPLCQQCGRLDAAGR